MSNCKLRLRPHHGMCMSYFQGNGYSPEFTARMWEILAQIEREPVEIHLTSDCDDLCACCPNREGSQCTLSSNVACFDRDVLTLCGLSFGQCLPAAEFFHLVRENILDLGKRETICGECRWSCLCTPQVMRFLCPPKQY